MNVMLDTHMIDSLRERG